MGKRVDRIKDIVRRFFAVDNTINENTVIGTVLIICAIVEGFTKPDPVIFGEFLTGGLACFSISLGKK